MAEVVHPRESGRWVAVEIATAFATSVAFFATCFSIRVKPTDRLGQVSGLASLDLRFTLAAIALVVLLITAARWRSGIHFDRAARLACASAAGLVSGMVAGALLVALHATPWGLAGETGDTVVLAQWAEQLRLGQAPPAIYPPLHIYGIAWLADLFHVPTLYAMKQFQLLGALLVTPVAYAAWRSLLRPVWALAIGVTVALPFIELYRLYPFIVLLAFLPLAIRFLEVVREAARFDPLQLARRAVVFGLAFGVLFLLYSGWYQWSAPGFAVALLVVFPWRAAPRRALLFCGIAALVFGVVGWNYIVAVLHGPAIKDNYVYFDATVDPAYVAMWRGNLPGAHAALWPPLGELGGVGLFSVLLAGGFAAAVALGRRTTAVITVSSIMAGAWLFRFWYAHSMWDTGLVQLYPRTTAELLYCALALTGLAVLFAVRRRGLVARPPAVIGSLCGLLFLYLQASSAIGDKYMPRDDSTDYGYLAWIAHRTPRMTENQAKWARVFPSSTIEHPPFAGSYLVDNRPATVFSTELSTTPDHEESIEIHFPLIRKFSQVVLVPASEGFPVDFTIDVWNGLDWVTRVRRTGQTPPAEPLVLPLGQSDYTSMLRLHVTRLGAVGSRYGVRLGELKVLR